MLNKPKGDLRGVFQSLPYGNLILAVWDYKGGLARKIILVVALVGSLLIYNHLTMEKPSTASTVTNTSKTSSTIINQSTGVTSVNNSGNVTFHNLGNAINQLGTNNQIFNSSMTACNITSTLISPNGVPISVANGMVQNLTVYYGSGPISTYSLNTQVEARLNQLEDKYKYATNAESQDILALTKLVKELNENTGDIHRLPDGRTQLGYVVVGTPYILDKYYVAMLANLSPTNANYVCALSNALISINIIETSNTAYDSRPDNVYVNPAAKGQIYMCAATLESLRGSNDVAYVYAQKAVGFDPIPINRVVLTSTMIPLLGKHYSNDDVTNSWEFSNKAITNYQAVESLNANYNLIQKEQVAILYAFGGAISFRNGRIEEAQKYLQIAGPLIPNIKPIK
jgi:hypothetical protein